MPNFLKELFRRNVFRVAAAYVIVGWIVLQVVGLLAPNLGLPAWTVAFVLVMLLAGFPIALLLAWAFELTPDGIKKSTKDFAPETSRIRKMELGMMGAALVMLGFAFFIPPPWSETVDSEPSFLPDADAESVAQRYSVAVLPFNNLSDERELSWIADGLSEDITTRIGSMIHLRVAARNSAFAWKGTSPDIREVGESLKVRFVLEGSIRRLGSGLRVSAQLIETETGTHIWTDSYDHSLSEHGGTQDNIVDMVAAEVMTAIRRTELSQTSNLPVPELTSDDLTNLGIEIAIVHPDILRFPEAIDLLEKAIDRNPLNSIAHGTLAQTYALVGEVDFAEDHLARAMEIAPNDTYTLHVSALAALGLNRPEQCLTYARRLLELNDEIPIGWDTRARCRVAAGDYAGSMADIETWKTLAGTRPFNYYNMMNAEISAQFGLRNWVEVEKAARESLVYFDDGRTRLFLIATLAQQGRLGEAEIEAGIYRGKPYAIDLDTDFGIRKLSWLDAMLSNDVRSGLMLAGFRFGISE